MKASPFNVIAYVDVCCIIRHREGHASRVHVEYRGRYRAYKLIQRELGKWLWARGTPLVRIESMTNVFDDTEGVTYPTRGTKGQA